MADVAEFDRKITEHENNITALRLKINGLVGDGKAYETLEVIQIGMALSQSVEGIKELKEQLTYMQAGTLRPRMEETQRTLGILLSKINERRVEDVFSDGGLKERLDEELYDLQETLNSMLTAAN